MSLLADVLGTFVGGGGLAGALGTITSAGISLAEKRMDYGHVIDMLPHEEQKWKYEIELQRQHAEHEQRLADQGLLIEVERSAWEGISTVIEADARETVASLGMAEQRWWVGAIRTLFRPFLTVILWFAVFAIWAASSDPAASTLLTSTVAQAAMGTMGVWFGQRIVGSASASGQ